MVVLTETLRNMETETSRRTALGTIVRGEIQGKGWTYRQAALKLSMGLATLNRVLAGDATIEDGTFRKIETGMDWPRYLCSHFIDGDRPWIDELSTDIRPGFDADMKRVMMEALAPKKPGRSSPRQARAI